MGHEALHLLPSGTDTKKSGAIPVISPYSTSQHNGHVTVSGLVEHADLLWKDRGPYYQQDTYWRVQNDLPDGHRTFAHPFTGLLVGTPQKGVLCLHVDMCLYVGSSCPHSRGCSLLAMHTNVVLILRTDGNVMAGNIMKAYRGRRGIVF